MRLLYYCCGVALLVLACGGDDAGASGLPSDAAIGNLSDSQREQLCAWRERLGGRCDDEFLGAFAPEDVDLIRDQAMASSCDRGFRDCDVPVSAFEQCYRRLCPLPSPPDNPPSDEPVETSTAQCDPLRECFLADAP